MLAFIDESGTIHPNDPSPVSALLAVCMAERTHRGVSRQIHSAKRTALGRDDAYELKAGELIKEKTFRRVLEKKELVETIFDLLSRLDITIFAIIVPRPTRPLNIPPGHLPAPHRYLLQRVNALAEEMKQEAILVYDGKGMNVQGWNMSACISHYIFKVAEYNNILRRIVDTALFVDSQVTPGIQLADLAASVVRQYEQHGLFMGVPPGNPYLSALNRFYSTIKEKTRNDLQSDYGHQLYGFYKCREEQLYQREEREQQEDLEPGE